MFNISLPDTALSIMFQYLGKADLKSARLVSKRWHRLVKQSLLYSSPTVGAGKTTLSHFEAISLNAAYSNVITEATIELDSSYGIWEEPQGDLQQSNLALLVRCLERFCKLKTLKLIIIPHWPENLNFYAPGASHAPALQLLQALLNSTSVSVEQLDYNDNEHRLYRVVSHVDAFHWPPLRSLTLSGFTVPNHEEFLVSMAPYRSSLRKIHLRNFNIQDHHDLWASGRWEPLLKSLREEYPLEAFSIANFEADEEVGDAPLCGRWRVCAPHGDSYDLVYWGLISDVEKIERLVSEWVLGADGNPFELYMVDRC